MAEDTIRILRVLEYTGSRKVVEENLGMRAVKGQRRFSEELTIREALLGEFPEVLQVIKGEPSIG